MRNKEKLSPKIDHSKRDFLRLLGLASALPLTPVDIEGLYRLFFPSINSNTEQSLENQEDRLSVAFKKFFPELESLAITNEQDISSLGAVKALEFWLTRVESYVKKAEEIKIQSGISKTAYQDTVKEVIVNYRRNIAQTVTYSEDKKIRKVELSLDAAEGADIAAEIIHPFQAPYQLENGVSAVTIEGMSNVIHVLLLKAWYEHNLQALAHGAESEALVMPLRAQINGQVQDLETPDVTTFNQYLSFIVESYTEEFTVAPLAQYKHDYLGEDKLGQSTMYSKKWAILQRPFYDDKISITDYQNSIEQMGVAFYQVVAKHDLNLEQAFILGAFINHGADNRFVNTDQKIVDAYNDLVASGLIVDAATWQQTLTDFSQVTVRELRINAVHALKNETFSGDERLTLEAFMVITDPDADKSYYDFLTKFDTPTVKLYFQHEENGSPVWYSINLEVSPHQTAGSTLAYALEVPKKIKIRSGLFAPTISLENKNMVIEVTQETVLGATLNVKQSFEIKGEFSTSAAEVAAQAVAVAEVASEKPSASGVSVQAASQEAVVDDALYDAMKTQLEKANSKTSFTR